ncbi:disks large-associated protein 5-like isoform X2 [Neocloeon triangulifer]|uniref:disks large-associated protein 5-like isoform X2 n=1 Tax=Neocloeon triangulifer TaxID=2078957 RepID=UPI00286F92BD|nr:disks large-associated protein 5-like isoform X2 [Neocloeon triangulifer]
MAGLGRENKRGWAGLTLHGSAAGCSTGWWSGLVLTKRFVVGSGKPLTATDEFAEVSSGEQNVSHVENAPVRKKNLKESLQKWQEEKKMRRELQQSKMRRPEFKVSSHVETVPVNKLPVLRSSLAYKNVTARVDTRRDNAGPTSFKPMRTEVPSKFNFGAKKVEALTNSGNIVPFVFNAPTPVPVKNVDISVKSGKGKKEKRAPVAFKTPEKALTPAAKRKKYPTTPRPALVTPSTNKNDEKTNQTDASLNVSLNAPSKQFLTSPETSPPAKKVRVSASGSSPSQTSEVPKRETKSNSLKRKSARIAEQLPAEAADKPKEGVAANLSTDFFRQILDSEINLLEKLCVAWESEMRKKEMTDFAEENVLQAVGMARLIIREKFAQFRGLIDNCDQPEDPKTKTLITDLQGFWDMIKIQSDQIQGKFVALDKLKSNNWQEEVAVVEKKTAPKKKQAPNKGSKPAVASRFREFLARKKVSPNSAEVMMKTPDTGKKIPTPKPRSVKAAETSLNESKKYVESPNANAIINVSIRAKRSVERKSLDNSANKSMHESSLVFPAASSPNKNLASGASKQESRQETPSRSILKKAQVTPAPNNERRCVLFDMIPEEAEEEEVDMLIPPVKHTYAQRTYEVSPPKDKFDELFDNIVSSTPAAKSGETTSDEEKENVTTKTKKMPKTKVTTPLRRSRRLSSIMNSTVNDSGIDTAAIDKSQESLIPITELPLDDSRVSKRRSSRKRVSTDVASGGSDLMSFDSPAPSVPVEKRKKRSTKRMLLDESM